MACERVVFSGVYEEAYQWRADVSFSLACMKKHISGVRTCHVQWLV